MLKQRGNKRRVLLAAFLFLMMFSVMTVNAQAEWRKNSNGTYSYYDSNGKKVKNKWINKEYYVNAKGVRHTGWLHKNNKWYYFDKSGKVIKNRWIRSSGKMYYAGSTGALFVNGRRKVGSDYYAFSKRGVRLTGSRKYGGKYYFFGKKTGKMLTKQWVTVNKKKYYYGADGVRVTNSWVGRYYVGSTGTRLTKAWKDGRYLGSDGRAVVGLKKIGKYYYYFDKNTYKKVTGTTLKLDGKTYQFDSKGRGTLISSNGAPATKVSVENTYYTDKCVDDETLLACIIYCEAGNQPYEGKMAVGMVLMNRVNSSLFPDKLREIVYQKNQFTPARSGALTKAIKQYATLVNDECKKAAKEVTARYKDYQEGDNVYLTIDGKKVNFNYLFFMTPSAYKSLGLTAAYKRIGDHVFFKVWK